MIMGIENELALGASVPLASDKKVRLLQEIVNGVQKEIQAVPHREGTACPMGFMLCTGARIYLDGEFVEIATPEVSTPQEAITYQRANELILLRALAKAAVRVQVRPEAVELIRASTDFTGQHFRGVHVNVMTRNFDTGMLVEHLIPFLVTRFYAAAGGVGPQGFTMTHKNVAIRTVTSTDARQNRPIVHLKKEPLAGRGYHRVHITHGDAVMSDLSMFLSVGCTANSDVTLFR